MNQQPISYYGGKQRMVSKILPLIHEHTLYVEPFFGGGAIFWAKAPSEVEVINDLNQRVIRLYHTLQHDFDRLQDMIKGSFNGRSLYQKAQLIYDYADLFSDVEVAWAVWYQANFSYSSKIKGGWAYDRLGVCNRKFVNKVDRFDEAFFHRLQSTQIESNDALKVIKSRDHSEAFFYVDPPYFNADMGHYKGYTKEDFEALLKCLSQIKGKFLLSSYPSPSLTKWTREKRWYTQKYESTISVRKGDRRKKKIEVLTANYRI